MGVFDSKQFQPFRFRTPDINRLRRFHSAWVSRLCGVESIGVKSKENFPVLSAETQIIGEEVLSPFTLLMISSIPAEGDS
jgi:hypothetical protein